MRQKKVSIRVYLYCNVLLLADDAIGWVCLCACVWMSKFVCLFLGAKIHSLMLNYVMLCSVDNAVFSAFCCGRFCLDVVDLVFVVIFAAVATLLLLLLLLLLLFFSLLTFSLFLLHLFVCFLFMSKSEYFAVIRVFVQNQCFLWFNNTDAIEHKMTHHRVRIRRAKFN